jgi:hypothetical protein
MASINNVGQQKALNQFAIGKTNKVFHLPIAISIKEPCQRVN